MDNQPNQPMPGGPTPAPVQSPQTTSTSNVHATLAYVLGFITGIYFYVTSQDKYIRFHAMQSILFSLVMIVINFVLGMLPGIGRLLSGLVSLAALVIWILLMLKAYKGEKYKLPVIGDYAEKHA